MTRHHFVCPTHFTATMARQTRMRNGVRETMRLCLHCNVGLFFDADTGEFIRFGDGRTTGLVEIPVPCGACGDRTLATRTIRRESFHATNTVSPVLSVRQCLSPQCARLSVYDRVDGEHVFVGHPLTQAERVTYQGKLCVFDGCNRERVKRKSMSPKRLYIYASKHCHAHRKQWHRNKKLKPIKERNVKPNNPIDPSRKRGQRALTAEQLEDVVLDYLDGMTADEVASKHKVSRNTVMRYLRKALPGKGRISTRRKELTS
jgi:predicted DNA-binding protein (UPF0251 family)